MMMLEVDYHGVIVHFGCFFQAEVVLPVSNHIHFCSHQRLVVVSGLLHERAAIDQPM